MRHAKEIDPILQIDDSISTGLVQIALRNMESLVLKDATRLNALRMASGAFERLLVPRKVIHCVRPRVAYYKCPTCGRRLRGIQPDPHCPACGQLLDWRPCDGQWEV